MATHIRPLSEAPRPRVEAFLQSRKFSNELIAWKYYDAAFNRGRGRGYVLLEGDEVHGILGIIPFAVADGARRWETGWVCDWHCAIPGAGGVLLQSALRSTEFLLAVGGNQNSRPIFCHVATRAEMEACREFYAPLRLGLYLRALSRKFPALRLDRLPGLARIPARRLVRRPGQEAVRTTPGVAREIAPLIEASPARGPYCAYDLDYVDWQAGRCPLLISGTSYLPGDPSPAAAAVYWRSVRSNAFWRIALWAREGADDALAAVRTEALVQIRRQGGWACSAVVSPDDQERLAGTRSAGFTLGHQQIPLFFLTANKTPPPVDKLHGLSFLDADSPYLFSSLQAS